MQFFYAQDDNTIELEIGQGAFVIVIPIEEAQIAETIVKGLILSTDPKSKDLQRMLLDMYKYVQVTHNMCDS